MQDAAVHALVCLIHADFGVLLTLFLYSREKFSPFGDKEAGLCAGWCRVASNPVIVVGNLMTLARADSEGEALQVTPTDLNEVFLEISEPAARGDAAPCQRERSITAEIVPDFD